LIGVPPRPPATAESSLSQQMDRAAPKGAMAMADSVGGGATPGLFSGTNDQLMNTALAGYARILGNKMSNSPSSPADLDLYRSRNGLPPIQTVQPVQPDLMKMFGPTLHTMGLGQ